MVKRKRKVVKRRRKRKFGNFIKDKVNNILGAIAAPFRGVLEKEPQFKDDNIKKELGEKLAGNAKKDIIIPTAAELKNKLKEDFKEYGTASDKLGNTIEFFKDKLNQGAEALYAMMDNMDLKKKYKKK